MTMIAICTKSGISVDEHFGHAGSFYVFDIDEYEMVLKEVRFAERYCDCFRPKEEFHREDRLARIWETISDCEMLFTMKIGVPPREWLEKKGLMIVEMDCPIADIKEKIRETNP